MTKDNSFTAKQVGERIRERRTELRLSMSQLGDRLSVNKSTIQRYETGGVDPERTILIVPIAEALETTPEWLTGKSDAKEYDSYTLCKKAIEQHISDYLDSMTSAVQGQPHQQLLTTFLGEIVDLYALFCEHFAAAMKAVDKIAEDEGLKESLRRYAIESGAITEKVYRKEMEAPVEDMKRFMDGLLHIYDEGRNNVKIGDLLGIKQEALSRLPEKDESVAP